MKEKSCGSIIFDNNKVLLIKQTAGHWTFPKGHVDAGETEVETALREVKEETNLNIQIDASKKYSINYTVENGNEKTVIFFIGKKLSGIETPQEGEVSEIKWVSFDEAINLLTHENSKDLLKKVLKDLKKN